MVGLVMGLFFNGSGVGECLFFFFWLWVGGCWREGNGLGCAGVVGLDPDGDGDWELAIGTL